MSKMTHGRELPADEYRFNGEGFSRQDCPQKLFDGLGGRSQVHDPSSGRVATAVSSGSAVLGLIPSSFFGAGRGYLASSPRAVRSPSPPRAFLSSSSSVECEL